MTEFWEAAFLEKQMMWGLEPAKSAVLAADHFAKMGVKDVLIPGIGYGRNAKAFLERGMSVTGIEISETAIALARTQLGLEIPIHHGSVGGMPYDHKQYDAVFCYGLIYLLDDPGRAKLLEDCSRQLAPGGHMFFTVISKEAPLYGGGTRLIYDEDSVRREFSPYGLIEFSRIDEPGARGGSMPFINVVCRAPSAVPTREQAKDLLGPEAQKLYEIDLLLRSLPDVRDKALPIRELIDREANALREAHRAGSPAAAFILRSTRADLPAWRQGTSMDETEAEILATELDLDLARRAMARWRGFAEWSDVLERGDQTVDPRFEAACDAIVAGDAESLRASLARDPLLVNARSPFPHGAMLIHYIAQNGVENNRQWQSPSNAVEIAEILLKAGADPNATCTAYSDRDTVLGLLVTSAHPAAAGVQADLVEVLCKASAKPDGPDDDGGPLWSAITSGYAEAAERLAKCGARVDNLVFAAAIGDLDRTRAFFDEAGRLKPGRAASGERIGARGPLLDERHMLEYALIFAAGHGRREVVELLLSKHPDLRVHEPLWDSTALGQAKYHRRADIIELLEPLYPPT